MVDGFDEPVVEEDVAVSTNDSNDEYLVNAPSGGGRVDDIASVDEDSARKAKKSVASSRKLSWQFLGLFAVTIGRRATWGSFPLIKQKL
ncbi:MAG: hypothetical protein LBP35_05225 [Candidatus Ancillula trichonymphae]|jgi:hypothetical protein|nr:hypothetical protein [Candidatus Ancillula trichonymphae]